MKAFQIIKHQYFQLAVSLLIFCAAFFISRYPFYKYFPVPQHVLQDGHLYYNTYRDILNGIADFGIITAGYPLFIAFAHIFSEKSVMLIIVQSIYGLLTCLFLIDVVNKYFNYVSILTAIALAIFVTQNNTLRFETSTFPDIIISYTLILFIALTISTLKGNKLHYPILLGLVITYLILLKSSTVFIIPITFVLLYFLLKNYQKRVAIALILSTLLPLLVYASYNFFTFNKFTILSSERMNKLNKNGMSEKEQMFLSKVAENAPEAHPYRILYTTNSPDKFARAHTLVRWGAYLDSTQNGQSLFKIRFEYDGVINIDSLFQSNVFHQDEITWFKKNKENLYNRVFRVHEELKIKRRILNFVGYLRNIQYKHHIFYLSEIGYRYNNIYISKEIISFPYSLSGGVEEDRKWLVREFYDTPQKTTQDFEEMLNTIHSNFFFKLYDVYSLYIGRPFTRHIVWFYIFLLISVATFILWIKHPKNPFFTLLLCVVLIHFGAASIHGIVVPNPLQRYSASTEFIPYLSLALSPLLRFGYRLAQK